MTNEMHNAHPLPPMDAKPGEVEQHTLWNGPVATRNVRDDYSTWGEIPVAVQSAVFAYDEARRAGLNEAPMSERNRISIAPMIKAALIAAGRGIDDVRDGEILRLRRELARATQDTRHDG